MRRRLTEQASMPKSALMTEPMGKEARLHAAAYAVGRAALPQMPGSQGLRGSRWPRSSGNSGPEGGHTHDNLPHHHR